jgi:Bacterial SH3 domain
MCALEAGVSKLVKAPILAIAWSFWAVVGLFIWARVLVISFLVFATMIALAPFGRGPPDPGPARQFDKALGLYGYGFARIWRSISGDSEAPDDPWGEGEGRRGFWASFANFLWQGFATLMFWAPIAFLLHHGGVVRIGLIERVEVWAAPAFGFGVEQHPASGDPCLGGDAISPRDPPQVFETIRDVNVRRGPGIDYERVERLPSAQKVTVVGSSPSGQWSLISIDGEIRCFVKSEYLRRSP